MRVLFATPECAPLTKTGGLGDVSAALPAALRLQGVDVRTLLPAYRGVRAALPQASVVERVSVLGQEVTLLQADPFILLDCPALYVRDGGPYQDAAGRDWPDNALRFGVLARCAAHIGSPASPLGWRAEVVHCNDWPTALTPVYLSGRDPRPACVMTVHNLAFQGLFDPSHLGRLELPRSAFTSEGLEFYGQLSFLKGGLVFADAITTVSPTYAREILTPEFGCGLDGLLRARASLLEGVANGIDAEAWDPATDARIAERYTAETLERKSANKLALQRRMQLVANARAPLFGAVCRFTAQKGVDLIAAAADALVALPAQLCLLGQGERALEATLAATAARHPGAMAVAVGFDEDLAHLIEAGADAFLMPSRFEPCGLNQMYSQRYGTPPVARATGGLVDTIVDGETGFLFADADSAALVRAVQRAVAAYRDETKWRSLQRRAMRQDFSWSASARRYTALYSRLASARRA